jgi:uncharacterized membrane protein YdbT with pleckstrin-like domain
MAFPTSMLQPDERLIRETKLHWVALYREILYTAGLLILIIVLLAATNFPGLVYVVLVIAWAVASFRGITNWYTTDLVLTNRRVIFRQGLLSKKGYEIPVDRVQDVGFRQSGLQRMVGAGDLMLETSASGGRTAVSNVPGPIEWKQLVSEARESRADHRFSQATQPHAEPSATQVATASSPSTGASRAEQLEILARLHRQGSLTDEEFNAEKARVLKEG